MTDLTDFQQKLSAFLPDMKLCFKEPMAKHTSFRIGGAAEAMAFPKNREELAQLMKVSGLLDIKPAILGAGTNVLAPDEGLRGLTICLKDALDGMERVDDTRIRVMAGVTMTRAAMFAAGLGLSGLEFAHGIPGSVGGGVYMNAGAYGGEMSQVLECARVLMPTGEIATLDAAALDMRYRHTALMASGGVVLSATFRLQPDDPAQIAARMADYAQRRREKQPLQYASSGSFFKRPEGYFAGKLIQDAGLKGASVGDVQISELHAGFLINRGSATAGDVLALMQRVQHEVEAQFGVKLEPEVRIIGEDEK